MNAMSTSDDAYQAFRAAYPTYGRTAILDELRRTEYHRLDDEGHIYLDYTGGGLYAESQVLAHVDSLRHHVYGNPHSNNPTALATTEWVEHARNYVLEYFHASPDDYVVVFTPNATGALKLVGESYPFAPGDQFAISTDDHNSVNGIREFAKARGATVTYVPLTWPELRPDLTALNDTLAQADPARHNLFAYPAQSNYSGVQHPLELIAQARQRGWDVLVDCAAFAPTNRLDLGRWQPDFASFSFYKMFGYPTGVGALIARRAALAKLRRPWFSGGTIRIVSVMADGFYFGDDAARYEDGTVNYLSIPAVEIGLRHIQRIGIDTIHERVTCLTGWLLDQLTTLRHSNGRPMTRIHGPTDVTMRGGTISTSWYDPTGVPIFGQLMERLAGAAGISIRTGCFCNPGSGETTFQLPQARMQEFFSREEGMQFSEFAHAMYEAEGMDISAVRLSVGLVTNFSDVYRFMQFVTSLRDRSAHELGAGEVSLPLVLRDTA